MDKDRTTIEDCTTDDGEAYDTLAASKSGAAPERVFPDGGEESGQKDPQKTDLGFMITMAGASAFVITELISIGFGIGGLINPSTKIALAVPSVVTAFWAIVLGLLYWRAQR